MAKGQRPTLPPHYYLEHFSEMLEFVATHYAHVVDARTFIDDFDSLSFEARCLYARLAKRKGRVFAVARLRYPEIGDLRQPLAELLQNGWLREPGIDEASDLLASMTVAQLRTFLKSRIAGVPGTAKKAALLAMAEVLLQRTGQSDGLPLAGRVVQARSAELGFLTFLYFGRADGGLDRFTMRDLGLVRGAGESDRYEPRFGEREEAEQAYFYATQIERLRCEPERLADIAADCEAGPAPEYDLAQRLRNRLLKRLGKAFEERDEHYAALRLYQLGDSVFCMQRVARLLLTTGQRDEAERYLETLIADSSSADLALFAEDLYARKFRKKKTSAMTDRLRDADVVAIDEAYSGRPETGVIRFFEAQGARAFRTENRLWRSFFGLLFWDLLFGRQSRTSPFEHLPAALEKRQFFTEQRQAIDERLELLAQQAALKQHLLKVSVAHYGEANGVFRWRKSLVDPLFALIDRAPASAMRAVLMRFCEDYPGSRYGYPDLMLIDSNGLRFVEVKTEGDQLRRNQWLRIEQLREAGLRADVLRVQWRVDPEQAYVVVDVETTGGRGIEHRVTEIGAVKLINGRIVDRYQTLLNPQRQIPPGITRLTGITPAMVADAPVFADVADAFATFLEGGIFVAHNVEFDYRFIGSEFRRLGRPFRMPKLCTCASMRRLYPGQRSYGLAALCESFDIDLETHHRALCDAEAAAGLLMIINERRQQLLDDSGLAAPSALQAHQ